MTAKEFAEECHNRGYAPKCCAKRYCKQSGKSDFTEADLLEVYRLCVGDWSDIDDWIVARMEQGHPKPKLAPTEGWFDEENWQTNF